MRNIEKKNYDQTFTQRRKIIGVMGSGSEDYPELTVPLGEFLAHQGYHLLNGGGAGVMAGISRAFYQTQPREGNLIGIIKSDREAVLIDGKRHFHPSNTNPWLEIPIYTHLPMSGEQGKDIRSRNHINVLSSDLIIVLPGRAGTRSEVELALEYGVPLIFFVGQYGVESLNIALVISQNNNVDIAHHIDDIALLLKEYFSSPR